MSIEVAVFQHVRNNVPSINQRVYALVAPQGIDEPYVVLNKVSGVREYTHTEQASLVTTRYQLTVYGKNYSNVKATVEEIRQAFSSFKGQMGGASGTYVAACFLQNEIDGFDQTLSSTDYYQVVVDYLIKHYE